MVNNKYNELMNVLIEAAHNIYLRNDEAKIDDLLTPRQKQEARNRRGKPEPKLYSGVPERRIPASKQTPLQKSIGGNLTKAHILHNLSLSKKARKISKYNESKSFEIDEVVNPQTKQKRKEISKKVKGLLGVKKYSRTSPDTVAIGDSGTVNIGRHSSYRADSTKHQIMKRRGIESEKPPGPTTRGIGRREEPTGETYVGRSRGRSSKAERRRALGQPEKRTTPTTKSQFIANRYIVRKGHPLGTEETQRIRFRKSQK
jgi:hypothetical protein